MAKSTVFPSPLERYPYRNAGAVGLRADLAKLPNRELLDQYAVLVMLPEEMRSASVLRMVVIRDILLERLDMAS